MCEEVNLTIAPACFLFVAAVLGGALTSVASGGGFLLFPALIFIGLPSINANATSMTAGWLGCGFPTSYKSRESSSRRLFEALFALVYRMLRRQE